MNSLNRHRIGIGLILLLISIIIFGYYFKLYKFDSTCKPIDLKAVNLDNLINKKNLIPIAIIGSGPAGLSAALYGARAAFYTVVFEGPKPGGQLTETTYVENWPGTKKQLGTELINQNKLQAETFGALMVNNIIECVDFSDWPFRLQTEEGQEVNALTVIIATGANPKLLDIPGEKEYFSYGLSTCAVCDAPFYKDKDVIVVGGGDSAVEEAMLLSSYAKSVKILVRRDVMRASPAMQERLKNIKNVQIMFNTSPVKILGDDKSVKAIEIKSNIDNKTSILSIDGIFLAIGHTPNTEIFKDFLPLDENGYIILPTRTQRTKIPGVFVAGDVEDHVYRQAGTAAGDGIKAGLDAVGFLQQIGFNDAIDKQLESNYYDPDKEKPVELKKLITNKDLNELLKDSKPLIVEVGADYCSSCKILLSAVKSAASKFSDKVNFAQINLDDESKELSQRFKIDAIPVLLVFKNGKLIDRYDKKIFKKRELFKLISQILES